MELKDAISVIDNANSLGSDPQELDTAYQMVLAHARREVRLNEPLTLELAAALGFVKQGFCYRLSYTEYCLVNLWQHNSGELCLQLGYMDSDYEVENPTLKDFIECVRMFGTKETYAIALEKLDAQLRPFERTTDTSVTITGK